MNGLEYVFLVFGSMLLIIAMAADQWYKNKKDE